VRTLGRIQHETNGGVRAELRTQNPEPEPRTPNAEPRTR